MEKAFLLLLSDMTRMVSSSYIYGGWLLHPTLPESTSLTFALLLLLSLYLLCFYIAL